MLRPILFKFVVLLAGFLALTSHAEAQSQTGGGQYRYLVLAGLKSGLKDEIAKITDVTWEKLTLDGDRGKQVCAAFALSGTYYQNRVLDVRDSDEIVVLLAQYRDGTRIEETCTLVTLHEGGIPQRNDVTFDSRGFDGGQEIPAQIGLPGLESDIGAAVEGSFKMLRIQLSGLAWPSVLARVASQDLDSHFPLAAT
ncbi:MAG: hypothetical protein HYX77_07885 [Acidobacteria bacterium]|nr:hypothetical protein [Acidobacteriota bacterium]